MQTQNNPSSLRRILEANAVFSATSALFFFVAARPLAAFLGADPLVISILTLVMIAYAALLWFRSSRPPLKRSFVLFTVLGDSTWVLLSLLLLVGGLFPFSTDAKWAIGITAACVDIFATLQYLEWRRMDE